MVGRVIGRLNWFTFRPFFWVLTAIYLSNRWLEWSAFPRPNWLRFYLDDLLCLPLILTVTLFVLRIFYGPQRRLSFYHILFAVLYVAIIFEVILPQFMDRYTADFLDLFFYAMGGALFYLFLNK